MSWSSLPRYAWLNRRTRLRSRTPLHRRTPLCRTRLDAQAPRPAVPDDVRLALGERSEGRCEAGLPGCRWYATDPHHRVTVKSGGRCCEAARAELDRLCDLLHLCRRCHNWVHAMGTPAFDAGWRVHEGFDPATVAVVYRGTPRWLDDVGGVHDYEAGVA
jgi:hypothetical protein